MSHLKAVIFLVIFTVVPIAGLIGLLLTADWWSFFFFLLASLPLILAGGGVVLRKIKVKRSRAAVF